MDAFKFAFVRSFIVAAVNARSADADVHRITTAFATLGCAFGDVVAAAVTITDVNSAVSVAESRQKTPLAKALCGPLAEL